MVLSGNLGTYRLPKASIRRIGRAGMYPWFFRGLRIRHVIASLPSELQFRPLGATTRDVLDQLRGLGYPVR